VYHDIVRKLPAQEAELQATFYSDLDEMLAISDCVVLATPAAPKGEKLIGKNRLQKFKKGSRFVNIARGTLYVFALPCLAKTPELGIIAAKDCFLSESYPFFLSV